MVMIEIAPEMISTMLMRTMAPDGAENENESR